MSDPRILDWHISDLTDEATAILIAGPVPTSLYAHDSRPAWEQLAERAAWDPFLPGKWFLTNEGWLATPGHRPLAPFMSAWHGHELVVVFEGGFCAIVQQDGSFSLSRID